MSMQDNVNALDSNCASPPTFQSSTVHQINAPYSRQRQAVACSGKIRLKRNTAAVITTNFMLLQLMAVSLCCYDFSHLTFLQ